MNGMPQMKKPILLTDGKRYRLLVQYVNCSVGSMTEDMYLTKDPIARNTVQESTSKDLFNDGHSDIFITSLKEH